MVFDNYSQNKVPSAKKNQAERIHDVMRIINYCRMNPRAFNTDYNEFNWRLWFNGENILYGEVDPTKIEEKEREGYLKWRYKMEDLLEKFPINATIKGQDKNKEVYNKENLILFVRALEMFHEVVNKIVYKHLSEVIFGDTDDVEVVENDMVVEED